jgi:hypothetical protein
LPSSHRSPSLPLFYCTHVLTIPKTACKVNGPTGPTTSFSPRKFIPTALYTNVQNNPQRTAGIHPSMELNSVCNIAPGGLAPTSCPARTCGRARARVNSRRSTEPAGTRPPAGEIGDVSPATVKLAHVRHHALAIVVASLCGRLSWDRPGPWASSHKSWSNDPAHLCL